MSTLKVDAIRHNSATSDAITMASDGTCAAKITSVGGGPLSHRNKVINGAMAISQRGSSFTNITGNSGSTYTLDRFKIQMNSFDQAVVTVSQDSSAPDGFAKSLKIQCTTAETSVENSEHARLMYDGEAFDFTDIGFGTSSAKKITLSFWVKSNLTGTWGINFWRGDANRSNLRTYTINSANTWEHKVITLVEDTTGGGVNSDNGYGLRINWGLATGANYAQSHSLDTWHTFESQYFYPYDARNTNLFSSTSNNFYLTGVQLEIGDTATSFEHRNYTDELLRCQRYFTFIPSGTVFPGRGNSGSSYIYSYQSTVPMRVSPTIGVSNDIAHGTFAVRRYRDGTGVSDSTSTPTTSSTYFSPNSNMIHLIQGGFSGADDRSATLFVGGGAITISAEL